MALPGMRRSVQDGFWGNAPLVQRRSRGGNRLGHSAQESSRLHRFEAPVFGTSRKYLTAEPMQPKRTGGTLIGDGAAAQLLDAWERNLLRMARHPPDIEGLSKRAAFSIVLHSFVIPGGYQPPTRQQPPSHRHPLCSPSRVQRCVILVQPLVSAKVQTHRPTAPDSGNSITALPTRTSTRRHSMRPELLLFVNPRAPAPNGPSISTDSTSASRAQFLTLVQKFHANSTVTSQSAECSYVQAGSS